MKNSNDVGGINGEHDFKTLIDEMKIRGYSRQTMDSYVYLNSRFLDYIKKSPKGVNKSDITNYLVLLYDGGKASATRHLVCSALKFYYETVLKRRFQLKHPKKSNKLSGVLGKQDILDMISALPNPKHRLVVELMYGSGLRVGEARKVKIGDFDIERKLLMIRGCKGGKDRVVNLSDRFISDFTQFARAENSYLFEPSGRPGRHICERTAQNIVKNAAKRAGIGKKAHPHTLRTSYATHLIENGVDISFVQRLLGHSRISTTQAYIRLNSNSLSKIKSPLD
ncbi:tyrosine-type recombinase/integrase [Candidatus Woesearchaeota archaeon]|nr:tyrosine-type recombinase/integrase [Candidatus Woesearchaeota archaeon]